MCEAELVAASIVWLVVEKQAVDSRVTAVIGSVIFKGDALGAVQPSDSKRILRD